MGFYRKIPVIVNAVRWDGTNFGEMEQLVRNCNEYCNAWLEQDLTFTIRTVDGDVILRIGDWLIRGIEGKLYPCKNSVFQETYERLT